MHEKGKSPEGKPSLGANTLEGGKVYNTLFLKSKGEHLLIVQIYVDDIIFGATHNDLCNEFSKMMRSEFEMSMMGELNFF